MRRPEPLDPAVEHGLRALDAALAGAPDADAELTALVADVRAVAPRQDDAARARLDARATAGFRSSAAPPRRLRLLADRRLMRRALLPAAGAVAAALVALVVVTGPLRGGESGSQGAALREHSGTAADQAAGGGTGSSGSGASKSAAAPSAAPAPGSAAAPPSAPGRRVERTVRLELGARADRFDSVTDDVVRTTQRAGGFVSESELLRNGGRGTATYVLRIPTARLDAAVAALSRLAHVRAIEQGSTDLTGATDGTAARLRDARTRRRALVGALATASGARAARLRERLAAARATERRLDRALRELRARTRYATVDLTVVAQRSNGATAPPKGGRWTPADAWHDARRGLEIAAGVLIIALAFAVPLALAAGLAAVAGGAVRRRRREGALDVL